MARQPRRSKDDLLNDEIIFLNHHMRTCRACSIAKRSKVLDDMCPAGMQAMFRVTIRLDDLVKLRIKAHQQGMRYIFACPDTSKHGKAYESTATPLTVVAVQDRLL